MSDPELIWLRPERGARGPAPARSRAEIAAAAVELADADGLAGVSMRHIAEALGVATMSLYNYVPGKEQLYDLMLDAVAGDWELPERPSGDPRADLAEFARQGLATLRRHPWVPAVVSTRLSLGPNSLRHLEYFLGAVSGVDLPAGTKMELFALMNGFLYVFAQWEASQRETTERIQSDMIKYMSQAVATGEYPNLAAIFAAPAEPADPSPDAAFERSLPRLIDVILGPELPIRAGARWQDTRGGAPQT
jgi:AcrR family transcriptional regulator